MAFTVIFFGLLSRILYLLLGHLASRVIVNFDRSTELLNNNMLKFLMRWDSIYFYMIAKYGTYKEKHWTVFFPLYPFLIHYIKKFFRWNIDEIFIGIALNNILFLINGYLLFQFSKMFYSKSDSLLISILYYIYPTTIIASSMYSETLFMFFFLLGLLSLKKFNNFLSLFFFSLCTITRSNGILFFFIIIIFEKNLLTGIFKSILIPIPYLVYQIVLFHNYKHLKVITPYSYIQEIYWDNGLLKFYTINENLPNFFVALPFLIFYGRAIFFLLYKYILEFRRRHIISIFNIVNIHKAVYVDDHNKNIVLCCVILLAVQTILLVLYFHLQIYMRFIMYNPLTYFITFTYCNKKKIGRLITMLYLNYSLIYTMMFCSYYPPT